jgi:hypothetical protein
VPEEPGEWEWLGVGIVTVEDHAVRPPIRGLS